MPTPRTVLINGQPVAMPANALAYKHADPIEDARWIYDERDLADIKADDPTLVVEPR